MTSQSDEVHIAHRFRGPPASGNGGYVVGLLAEWIDGPAEVTLLAPPPLDVPLHRRRDDLDVMLFDATTNFARGRPLDEPTAGMSVDDVPVVLDLIRALKARKDRLILLVEHKMDVVRELSDRIIVLHNGALVADGEPATVIASPVVQQAYLGMAAEEPA